MISEELSILIVIKDKEGLEKCLSLSRSCGLKSFGASSFEELKQMQSNNGFDLLLIDLQFEENNDKTVFNAIQYSLESQPQLTIIVMTNSLDKSLYDKYLSLNIAHFIKKPIINADEFLVYINLALQKKHTLKKNDSFEININQFSNNDSFKIYNNGVIISSKHDKILSSVAKHKKIPLVLFGETGTGKEEFAKILHKKRVEIEGMIPFVTVNCSLLDNDLTSSLLFGHKKGAFTGANETTNGYVASADGGILFLDEVHTLSLPTQRKLLRVLNDGSYNRVGDMRSIHSYFQLVVATTKDLDDEVESGRMLADFKYRISGAEIFLDSLKDRMNEIPLLISIFFKRENIEISEDLILEISKLCQNYQWKGNIRQLFRVLQRMLINSQLQDEKLSIHHLTLPRDSILDKHVLSRVNQNNVELETYPINLLKNALQDDCSLNDVIDEIEKAIIVNAIKRYDSIAKSHLALGISRNAIDAKRKKYKI